MQLDSNRWCWHTWLPSRTSDHLICLLFINTYLPGKHSEPSPSSFGKPQYQAKHQAHLLPSPPPLVVAWMALAVGQATPIMRQRDLKSRMKRTQNDQIKTVYNRRPFPSQKGIISNPVEPDWKETIFKCQCIHLVLKTFFFFFLFCFCIHEAFWSTYNG